MVVSLILRLRWIAPPNRTTWLLTGKHRIVAGQFPQGQNAEFVKVG